LLALTMSSSPSSFPYPCIPRPSSGTRHFAMLRGSVQTSRLKLLLQVYSRPTPPPPPPPSALIPCVPTASVAPLQLVDSRAATPRGRGRSKDALGRQSSKSVNFAPDVPQDPKQGAAKMVASMDYSVCFSPTIDAKRGGIPGQGIDYR
jgi:hypothetical protein